MRAPGTSVSPMTAAFSAADQRRRRTDPVETAPRLSSPCALSSPSNITITRSSLLLQAKQTLRLLPLKKGARAPLTAYRPQPHTPRRKMAAADRLFRIAAHPTVTRPPSWQSRFFAPQLTGCGKTLGNIRHRFDFLRPEQARRERLSDAWAGSSERSSERLREPGGDGAAGSSTAPDPPAGERSPGASVA